MKLPPLNALKAFEAAARTGSFVDAGKALGVSSAAVSQQVRSLEEYWGRRLFIRQGNRIALTEAGRSTYPRLSAAFETIAELSDTLSDVPSRRRLVLSVPASLAVTWLPRKLRHLGGNGPALEVRIEEDPVSFGLDGADLRVFYGHGLYGEYQVETLYQDHIIAVASPEFARQHLGQGLATLDARHLIHTEWGANYATSPNWTDWLAKYAERRHLPLGSGILADQSSLSQS
ncbi:MAG: LysR family transcriptional regulator, partial [Rhodobacteraceae bacterium]|nr:LysR family transcriptional regulator [Paracoccaceae bacterium]